MRLEDRKVGREEEDLLGDKKDGKEKTWLDITIGLHLVNWGIL